MSNVDKIIILAKVKPGSEIFVMRKLKDVPGVIHSQILFGEYDILIHMAGTDESENANKVLSAMDEVIKVTTIDHI